MAENEKMENIPEIQEKEAVTKPKKKNKLVNKIIYFALLAFFISVFAYSAYYIASYAVESKQNGDSYTNLAEQVGILRGENANEDTSGATIGTTPAGGEDEGGEASSSILPEYQALYEMNPHLVGWINVPGTNIDYPVMQSVDEPNLYLDHDFYGESSKWGCIYVREACDIFTPGDNVVIYGHHMKDGTMFAALDAYKKKDYWEENQYLTFDTIYERHTYQIIAVFKTSANIGQGFAYHIFNTAENEEEFDAFMESVHEIQMYDTGLTAEYGDMLITLSTCEYTLNNGRFVVIAKRVS